MNAPERLLEMVEYLVGFVMVAVFVAIVIGMIVAALSGVWPS